jgi:two-component system response regulator ResD
MYGRSSRIALPGVTLGRVDEDANGGARILVVDDDTSIRTLLRRLLTTAGYAVDEAGDGPSALEKVPTFGPDLLLLDIMMPGQDGLDVLARLRETSDVPVILLTAKGDEVHRVLGFRFGADDYVVKPFSTAELVGRIGAVLRRTGAGRGNHHHELRFDGLHIDPATRRVTVHGQPVELPAREYELLSFLAASPEQAFSREQLLDRLWPASADRNPATVTEHIARIRRRIEDDPERPRWVRTVRGVGYRFDP